MYKVSDSVTGRLSKFQDRNFLAVCKVGRENLADDTLLPVPPVPDEHGDTEAAVRFDEVAVVVVGQLDM